MYSNSTNWNEFWGNWEDLKPYKDDAIEAESKFSIGDEVILKNSKKQEIGKILKIVGINDFNMFEYRVKFNCGSFRHCFEHELQFSSLTCQCGAEKVYGSSCLKTYHALWCPKRNV